MTRIVTLTLNPTIDVAYTLDHLAHSDKLRAASQRCDPGGGGINVARVFVRMGGDARCVYMSGGSTGIALDALLDLHQLARTPITIQGETRISSTVFERLSGKEYRIVPAGPKISETECQACLDQLAVIDCDYLVISGSMPRGVPDDFYAKVAFEAQQRGIRVVLDSSGEPLRAAIASGNIELAKPNLKEFQELILEDITDPFEIGEAAQEIVRKGGARLIVISLAERGGVLASAENVTLCKAPTVETASSVGAGDSCVAAMVQGLALGLNDKEAFKMGIAAGGAALLTPGTGLAQAKDIDQLYRKMTGSS